MNERALEGDVARVSAEFHAGGGESRMEVQIMTIAGDVFKVDVSSHDTVRKHCRRLSVLC